MKRWLPLSHLLLCPFVSAQFPAQPVYDQTVPGKLGDGFQVSFKQNTICETTPGVKSYSGYITTPPSNYSKTAVNSFFWFFESRKDPANAPLVLWIGGGPGFNSISSAVADVGPCTVNPDSNSTRLNPWSFNNEANILFIDQPNMIGFSYDERVNGSINFNSPAGAALLITPETQSPLPEPNATIALGTFPSQDLNNTANSTGNAAHIFWADVQTWLHAFPQYQPKDKKLSLWTESYGGRYGPEFASLFYEKNDQIAAGQIPGAEALEFDTMGLINAWLDPVLHLDAYPDFAVNNTYDIHMVNSTVYAAMRSNLTSPGGCLDLVSACQSAATTEDPQDTGTNSTLDDLCARALGSCIAGVQSVPPALSGRTDDDISQLAPASIVTPYYVGFFAQGWVQAALGAAVNFTDNSVPILEAFSGTGDLVRRGQLAALGRLLDRGVQATIVNGDLDYQINWFGGEAASLALEWAGTREFAGAGYAELRTNATYVGGRVRQMGRLSFTRAFKAGHQGAAYQPETYFRIFDRAMKHLMVADGCRPIEGPNGTSLATIGPQSVMDIRQKAPAEVPPLCYQRSASLQCTPEQLKLISSGKAVFKDYVLQN